MPFYPNGVPGGGGAGTAALFGGFFLFWFIVSIVIWAIVIWAYGTLLKAALNQPKAMALLLLIPIVNIVMIIVWGVQAHNAIKEREAGPMGGEKAA